jgi:hypothetical protein
MPMSGKAMKKLYEEKGGLERILLKRLKGKK